MMHRDALGKAEHPHLEYLSPRNDGVCRYPLPKPLFPWSLSQASTAVLDLPQGDPSSPAGFASRFKEPQMQKGFQDIVHIEFEV